MTNYMYVPVRTVSCIYTVRIWCQPKRMKRAASPCEWL